ncbi:hypothetical protein DU472_00950 [Campylobacter novaezeelandiae]|uniref:Uncharacterized protein n=1 Tax=Campylobacter novaezeelandiae TaxID=2267891 RepID=A0A4Q9JUT9_9BACT|nr:hypothetical protein [Campylobacter novaezeelandiae]TBR81266.1 hypothetical protein DU473_04040 [Campylobacter novaezeelandiae]TBR82584.1 hypothetical protein DU472_00950 [Campylobacter novaezeelandiae]
MLVGLANPYQNLALTHYEKSTLLNLNNKQETIDVNNELNPFLDYKFTQTTYPSEFGFRINEQGFFSEDLNRISRIPEAYQIHIKSARSIAKEMVRQDENLNYNQIDLPYILNSYYSSLKAVNQNFGENDNNSLSRDEISKLMQGFSTDNGNLLGQVNRIYENQEVLNLTLDKNKNLNTLMLDNKIINFHFDKAINNTSSNDIIKPYLSKNSEVSKSGLLVNFIYQDIKSKNEEEINFFMKPISLDLNSHKNLYKILEGKESIEDYIKENNEKKMSFDLYLYVNGVDKNTISKEKLSVFFQQYINYQKDMDLREFANSSSIFKIYTDSLVKEFDTLKQEYQNQNNNKNLSQINQEKTQSFNYFLKHRERQANLNKILYSYINVMS